MSALCRLVGGLLLAMAVVGIMLRENVAAVACGVASMAAFIGSFAAVMAERAGRPDSRPDHE
jgi:hypothetical protein